MLTGLDEVELEARSLPISNDKSARYFHALLQK